MATKQHKINQLITVSQKNDFAPSRYTVTNFDAPVYSRKTKNFKSPEDFADFCQRYNYEMIESKPNHENYRLKTVGVYLVRSFKKECFFSRKKAEQYVKTNLSKLWDAYIHQDDEYDLSF